MRVDIKRTALYNELAHDPKLQVELFDYTRDKFKNNIDTFYYSVYLQENSSEEYKWSLSKLFMELDFCKNELKSSKNKNALVEYKGLEVCFGSYGQVYNYRLSSPERFDIFIADYLPNANTPRVVVQIRSNALWLEDIYTLMQDTYNKVASIFGEYGIEIKKTMENRVDYAYHTNSVQSPTKFFSDKNMEASLNTNLKIYSKVGNINSSGISIDYLSLGNRKSNNVFFRAYNKSKEVIEMGYKAFFIEHWYRSKMISFYDKYCYEYAYLNKSYGSLDKARLEFYLLYGKDCSIKSEIKKLFNTANSYDDFKVYADKICPKVTIILNFEYQTKRKFYYYADEHIDNLLPCSDQSSKLSRLFTIYENRGLFLDYLTKETVSFVDKSKHSKDEPCFKSFWKRLRSLKLENCNKVDSEYERDYSNKIDKELVEKRMINTVATFSLYNNSPDSNFLDDFSGLLSCLNDNDFKNKMTILTEDGEVLDDSFFTDRSTLKSYRKYKEKRHKQLKNKLDSLGKNSYSNSQPMSNGVV